MMFTYSVKHTYIYTVAPKHQVNVVTLILHDTLRWYLEVLPWGVTLRCYCDTIAIALNMSYLCMVISFNLNLRCFCYNGMHYCDAQGVSLEPLYLHWNSLCMYVCSYMYTAAMLIVTPEMLIRFLYTYSC